MLQIDHRVSHDVDIFLPDPQVLPFLNPQTQNFKLEIWPADYQGDGARSLKLAFKDIGEIDFNRCTFIDLHANHINDGGRRRRSA